MSTTKKNPPIVQPYLFFEGRCEEAMEFYKRALGAEVMMLMRYKDSPEPPDPGSGTAPPGDKVMHVTFRIGRTILMAADGLCTSEASFQGFAMSLAVRTEDEAERYFAALKDGGRVRAPLEKTFFSPRFGMVTDRFGVLWMIMVTREETH
jgi:PhnB protein